MQLCEFSSLLFALHMISCSDQHELSTERLPLSIGETTVHLLVHRSREEGLTYLSLHDDENTAVEAAMDVLRERGGTLFELSHTGERYLSFQLGDSTFTVDPNRIFTRRGTASTLARLGASSQRSRDAVRSFADELLQQLDFYALAVVVTVHNNSDGAYSVMSYADDGGELTGDARFVHVG